MLDSVENCWSFFIDKVRRFLHIVLCFSPVGDKFRIRARQFPALVNCTMFDWFHSWPNEALVSVAQVRHRPTKRGRSRSRSRSRSG